MSLLKYYAPKYINLRNKVPILSQTVPAKNLPEIALPYYCECSPEFRDCENRLHIVGMQSQFYVRSIFSVFRESYAKITPFSIASLYLTDKNYVSAKIGFFQEFGFILFSVKNYFEVLLLIWLFEREK